MISLYVQLLTATLLSLRTNGAPIEEVTAARHSLQLDDFVAGEIICTGHQLEDNFEDKLASAAARMDEICLSDLGLYVNYHNPTVGTEGNTMVYACTYGSVASCNSIRFFELNPRFDEACPGQGAWMYNESTSASYGRDPIKTVECYT